MMGYCDDGDDDESDYYYYYYKDDSLLNYLKLHSVSVRRRHLDVLFLTNIFNDLKSCKQSAYLCWIEILETLD
jgi:hypothetical protein